MCGIFGIVNPVKENINGNLDKMLRVLRHRGPDGENIHFFQQVGTSNSIKFFTFKDLS